MRHVLLMGTPVVLLFAFQIGSLELYSEKSVVFLFTTCALLGLPLFIVAFVAARHLLFVVTNKRVIVRSSFWRTTTDGFSIAISAVKHIDIISHGATYGSVYLTYDKTSPRENSKDSEPDYPRPWPVRRAPNEASGGFVPIRRTNSILVSMNSPWPRLLGFYGFNGFDEFANLISEQQDRVPRRSAPRAVV